MKNAEQLSIHIVLIGSIALMIGCEPTKLLPDEQADASEPISANDDSGASDYTDTTDGMDANDSVDGDDTNDGMDAVDGVDGLDAVSVSDTVATLTFLVDDSANKTYTAEDGLAWKGSFSFDEDDNIVTFDGAWSGPFVPLWDDGPRSDGGHEPEDQIAGDSVWSVAVNVGSPLSDTVFEYGAIRNSIDGSDGEWIWATDNGTFTVPAYSEETIAVQGLTIEAHGWIDARISIDTSEIDPSFMLEPPQFVEVKSSAWGWSEQPMTDDGSMDAIPNDGIYSVTLGTITGPDTELPNNGLLNPGALPEFVFVLDDIEYKVLGVPPAEEGGARCEVRLAGEWIELDVQNQPDGDQNTYVVIPWAPLEETMGVNFVLDDSANQTYDISDGLAVKGSFSYASNTRSMTYDADWNGPFAPLHDDGPWTKGGHEPIGATANDHIWGLTAWIPSESTDIYEYGMVRDYADGSSGEWIWTGDNGTFTVGPGATMVDPPGLTLEPHGTINLRLELDTNALDDPFADVTLSQIQVKGSAWGWSLITLADDGLNGDLTAGDGVYTFVLSLYAGKHDGLLAAGDVAEFVFVINDEEYKVGDTKLTGGLSAWSDANSTGSDTCVTKTAACEPKSIYTAAQQNNNPAVSI